MVRSGRLALGLVLAVLGCGVSAPRPPPATPATPPAAAPEGTTAAASTADTRPAPAADAPTTWTAIYARYFGPSTEGGCGRSRACHADVMTGPSAAYEWLARRGYISGTDSPLVSTVNSCLRWFGGNMPPGGRPNAEAARDLAAWVAAGARDD